MKAKKHIEKGKELFREEKYEAALKEFSAAIELEPNNFNNWIMRGLCYLATDQLGRAMLDFEEGSRRMEATKCLS